MVGTMDAVWDSVRVALGRASVPPIADDANISLNYIPLLSFLLSLVIKSRIRSRLET